MFLSSQEVECLTGKKRPSPTDDAIIHVLETTYDVAPDIVVTWIMNMAKRLQSRSAA